jgi:hypothetical protein
MFGDVLKGNLTKGSKLSVVAVYFTIFNFKYRNIQEE